MKDEKGVIFIKDSRLRFPSTKKKWMRSSNASAQPWLLLPKW